MVGRAWGSTRPVRVIMALALSAATLLLYLPVRDFDFIRCDDPDYIQGNWVVQEGFSREAALTVFGSFQQGVWIPLTWLSYQADTELQGTAPSGYHLTNALLHSVNVGLLVLLLESCTGMLWPAVAAASLLAFHPLHVESVAWISERKDVLSLFFGLLCLRVYVWYVRRPSPGRYLSVLALFVAALASKPMMITLPFLMLLLDWWPLNRTASRRLLIVAEKVPLLAVAAAVGILTYLGHLRADSLVGLGQIPLPARLGNAVVYLVFYLWKTLWPARLGMYYFDPEETFDLLSMVGAALVVAGATGLVISLRRRWPAGIVGWSWFVVGLLPVLGVVRWGGQMVADRFTYLPLIGVYFGFAWGLRSIVRSRPFAAVAAAAVAFMLLAGCLAAATSTQLAYWRNGVLFFKHSVAVSPRSRIARVNLANNLAGQGEPEAAETEFRNLLAEHRPSPFVWADYGVFLHDQGRYREALAAYKRALEISPANGEIILFEGMALFESGDRPGAEARFRRALALSPDDPDRLANLGTLLAETSREVEAEQLFLQALAVAPRHPLASRNLDVLRRNRAANRP